jgi:micrococcal nuclease
LAARHERGYAGSRRRRAVLIGLGLIGTALVVCLDRGVVGPRWSGQSHPAASQSDDDVARYHGRSFAVARVIDGDTLELQVADGDAVVTKVRLLGVDAPESGHSQVGAMCFANEATAFVRQSAAGRPVTVYLDEGGDTRGRYGRLLAYIELPGGVFLNERLLEEGYAYADLRFDHGYFRKYQQLERGARAMRRGLWAEVSRGQLPAWLQRMRPELLADD